jgi:phage replication O-like protein O
MTTPDDANKKYTRIPNSVLEWLFGPEHDLSLRQVKVLLVVFRYTYGFSRRSAPLSSRFVADQTGIDQAHVCRALKSLAEAGLLAVSFERKIGFYTLVPRAYKNKKTRVVESSDDALSASRCSFGHETDALSASKIQRNKKGSGGDDAASLGSEQLEELQLEEFAKHGRVLTAPLVEETPPPPPGAVDFSQLF